MNPRWKWLIVASLAAAVIAPSLAACGSSPPSTAHQSGIIQAAPSKQDGCRFATAAEIASASGMPVVQSTDNGIVSTKFSPGCWYSDLPPGDEAGHADVRVDLYGGEWDARMAKIEADPKAIVNELPSLGEQAKYVTVVNQPDGTLLVKVDSTRGFSIKLSSETNNPQEREVAVAKLILPRIQAE